MQIHGPAHLHGAQPINSPHRPQRMEAGSQAGRVSQVDQLDISQEADLVSRARESSDIRADRVAEVRAAIAEGAYETPEKLDIAVGRLLDEIGG